MSGEWQRYFTHSPHKRAKKARAFVSDKPFRLSLEITRMTGAYRFVTPS